jgi:hypothetical protein
MPWTLRFFGTVTHLLVLRRLSAGGSPIPCESAAVCRRDSRHSLIAVARRRSSSAPCGLPRCCSSRGRVSRRRSRLDRRATRARPRKLRRLRSERLGPRSDARQRLRQHRLNGCQLRRGRLPAGRGAAGTGCPLRPALRPPTKRHPLHTAGPVAADRCSYSREAAALPRSAGYRWQAGARLSSDSLLAVDELVEDVPKPLDLRDGERNADAGPRFR